MEAFTAGTWWLIPLLALWIVIHTAVRAALRDDRPEANRDTP